MKYHMSKILNEVNEWDEIEGADTVEGPSRRVTREHIMQAFKQLKIGKAPWSSVLHKMISAGADIRIRMVIENCQTILDGKAMPAYWDTSIAIPISK